MRINAYLARASGLSRRAADQAVTAGRVQVNGQVAQVGQIIGPDDTVMLDRRAITPTVKTRTILFNKPVGYVVSRTGQGSRTIYELLSPEYQELKPVGRLDKDSSGLLLLTNDGQLANRLAHPRYSKTKVYEITLDKPLTPGDKKQIEQGVELDDGISKFQIENLSGARLAAILGEGRNRQIRRTFAALGYTVTRLHRVQFGDYRLDGLTPGEVRQI